eukprot:Em0015g1230a
MSLEEEVGLLHVSLICVSEVLIFSSFPALKCPMLVSIRGHEVALESHTSRRIRSRHNWWLKRTYVTLKRSEGGVLDAVEAVEHLAKVRHWKAFKVLEDLMLQNKPLRAAVDKEMKDLSYQTFQLLYYAYAARERSDIRHIYASVCSGNLETAILPPVSNGRTGRRRSSLAGLLAPRQPCKPAIERSISLPAAGALNMSICNFIMFLKTSLGTVSMEEAVGIIKKYELSTSNDPALDTAVSCISLLGFTRYMLCQDATPPRGGAEQDMTAPLVDYLIASSHNTYLTGHQLHGESSTLMYTLDVIETISEHAFAVTPYPSSSHLRTTVPCPNK